MTMVLGQTTKLYDPKNLTSSLQELKGINSCFSHRSNWCSQQWHEGILHNQQIGGGRLKNANPACTDQSIEIDRLVCSAIKLSSSRGIHQCSKQDIRRLSRTQNCCIFRVKQTSFHPKKIQWIGFKTWRNMHLLITKKWLPLQTMTRGDHAITTLCFYPPPKLFDIRVFHNGMRLGLLHPEHPWRLLGCITCVNRAWEASIKNNIEIAHPAKKSSTDVKGTT